MNIDLSNIYQKREAESRSLSAENYRGEKGKGGMATTETTLFPNGAQCARELGQGWATLPCRGMGGGGSMPHDSTSPYKSI